MLPVQATIFQKFPHDNIIKTFSPIQHDGDVFLPMELCDEDLFYNMEQHGFLTESAARFVFQQVLSALWHSHAHGIYHCDVKPENILVRTIEVPCPSMSMSRYRLLYGCTVLAWRMRAAALERLRSEAPTSPAALRVHLRLAAPLLYAHVFDRCHMDKHIILVVR